MLEKRSIDLGDMYEYKERRKEIKGRKLIRNYTLVCYCRNCSRK